MIDSIYDMTMMSRSFQHIIRFKMFPTFLVARIEVCFTSLVLIFISTGNFKHN